MGLTTFAQERVPRDLLTGNFTKEQLAEVLVEPGAWQPFPGLDQREVWEGLPDNYRDALILEAENYLDYHWPVIPATTALDFTRTGDRSVYSGISFGRRRALAALVMGELIENKGRFIDQIINGIWAISEETYWGISAHVGGKRESRRLMGDIILSEQDVVNRVEYPDAAVTATWGLDLHHADSLNSVYFPGEEFYSWYDHPKHEPYEIPYRCLYSRNIDNLFMAGRCISVTHVALGTVRVMRTGGMMGEVVGMAAAIASKHNTDPRSVYEEHLEDLISAMEQGVGSKKLKLNKPRS